MKNDFGETVDLRRVKIDKSLPAGARIAHFKRDIGNPYVFRVGDTRVGISFADGGAPLQERLLEVFTQANITKL